MARSGICRAQGKSCTNGGRVFVDTNIFVYACDIESGEKHKISIEILKDLWISGCGVISTQVLQEFFATVTKKITRPLDVKTARGIVNDLLKWRLVTHNGDSILDAIDIHSRYNYSFCDSMIIESAARGGASLLCSEDLADGQIIQGVAIRNPFPR